MLLTGPGEEAYSETAKALLDGNVEDALLMSYQARQCIGVEIRDQAAVAARPQLKPPIAMLSGTHCEHRGVQKVINSLGGVPVLCFLLAQVSF